MSFNPEIHHRRSIRFRGYDYASPGNYFITLCTENNRHLFGLISDGQMLTNEAGQMIEQTWSQLPQFFPGIVLDVFQIMPNHFHGIIKIVGAGLCARPDISKDSLPDVSAQSPPPALGDIVRRFKTITARQYAEGVMHSNWPPYPKRLWQRSYYDHIIRNDFDLNRIREYITQNPLLWPLDNYNISSH